MNRAIVLFVGLGLTTPSFAWTTPERIDRRPDDYVVYMVTAAANDRGGIHAAWSECKRGTYYEKIMHAFRVNDTWSIPENISRDSGDLRWAAITLDTAGRPFVVWSEEGAARLRYVRYVGDTWTLPRLVASTNGIEPQLVTDSRNRIHLVFEGFSGEHAIWYSQFDWTGDSWSMPAAIARASDDLGKSCLAVDGYDHLHAVWSNWQTRGLGYSQYVGAVWSEPETLPDPSSGTYSRYPVVAADSLGQANVVFEEGLPYWTRRVNGRWADAVPICSLRIYRPIIGYGADGAGNAIWSDQRSDIWSARFDGSNWSAPSLVVESTVVWYCGHLLPGADRLRLVWRGGDFVALFSEEVSGSVLETRVAPDVRHHHAGLCRSLVEFELRALPWERGEAALYSSAGLCVRTLHAQADASGCIRLRVEARGLAQGLYTLAVTTQSTRELVRLVLVR